MAAGLAAVLCGGLTSSPGGAAFAIHPAGVARVAGPLGAIDKIRCCRWGPRGWYDT
jgi:hypothetical protein